MRTITLALLLSTVVLSQVKTETKKTVSAVDGAKTAWKNAEATIIRLRNEAAQLAAEWQNRQTQIRDAQIQQKEAELTLQSELCKTGERIAVAPDVTTTCAPAKEKKE